MFSSVATDFGSWTNNKLLHARYFLLISFALHVARGLQVYKGKVKYFLRKPTYMRTATV